MDFVDTHCHIQFGDYPLDAELVLKNASEAGVVCMIAVGCTLADSQAAPVFAAKYDQVWASIGLHPHEAAKYVGDEHALQQFRDLAGKNKVIAVGETGLDYYYEHSPKEQQIKILRFQLDLAKEHDLPLILHIRDAFDDFWPIWDEYSGLTGVVHSFSATKRELQQALDRGLYIGLNGIMTFSKNSEQLEAAKAVPLDKLLLETDAPFLTPTPYRGTICEPKHVAVTAEFLANLRGESLDQLASVTTANAKRLFKLT